MTECFSCNTPLPAAMIKHVKETESPVRIPDVLNTIVDRKREITYHIMAYRPLTREEMALALRQYWAQKGSLKVERGSTVTIVSVIGDDD
jgi:hypothetical protein